MGAEPDDGTYVDAPGENAGIRPGDTLVVYGREDRIQELSGRVGDESAAHEAAVEELAGPTAGRE